ncbi:hypothetical protein BsWGS_28327 [Bradybaena similaris]
MNAREAIVSAWIFLLWITFYEAQSDTYRRPSSPWFQREDGITCTPGNQSGCASGECCVKEVITFKDLDRNMVVSTRCQPLLTLGELCLRRAEGYLCDCQKGLHCVFSRNESYGHCSPET